MTAKAGIPHARKSLASQSLRRPERLLVLRQESFISPHWICFKASFLEATVG